MTKATTETTKKPAAKTATKAPARTATKSAVKAVTKKPVAAKVAKTGKTLKVTQTKSLIGTKQSHRDTIRGLGLRHINHTVQLEDTPCVRGMINKVYYMVKCEA
jgi:large subunit ribosomal protein L30